MLRILVPIDFSEIADNALRYAMSLTAGWQSELHLYHIYQLNKFDYDRNAPDDDQPAVRLLYKSMNATKVKFSDQIIGFGLTVMTTVEEVDSLSLFTQRVRKHKFDLVIMGSKGASGIRKVVYGSFAANAIEWSMIPVWIIPPHSKYAPIKHIVLAVDDQEVPSSLWSLFQILAKRDLAKVTIVKVKSGFTLSTPPREEMIIPGVEWDYVEIPLKRNINQTINDYVTSENVDLLCMIRREKDFISSLFRKSITRNQALTTNIPLLIVPEIYHMRVNAFKGR